MKHFSLDSLLFGAACLFATAAVSAISPDNAPAADNSPAAEQASLEVHEDFEIELFADESLGIANPVAMQWDSRGRLWVLCTLAYAQMKPGEIPDDKLFILEDTDGDGKADRSILFAGGLEMPMGFALGHGGVWVAEGPDLLHLRDTDGNDKADEREVILTGFGTGDTHQNISNLKFDAGGFLYFTQGLHAFSQVETPWGISRGDTAGFWRFDPRTTRLAPFGFPSMTSQNPCGVAFDRWGSLFIKSNAPHLCYATPAMIPTTHSRELMISGRVGETPGKSMGGAIVESDHLPEWIQGHAIIAGYFAREVSAIPLVEEGSGFSISNPIRLVYGGHPSFRPVDTLQGPDGAIYVADWFNPVINHYQVSLRHPDRDYSHGRIWRIRAKDRELISPPDLEKLTQEQLFEQLKSGERWIRDQVKRLLSETRLPGQKRSGDTSDEILTKALETWALENLDPGEAADSHALAEASGILESYGAVSPAILANLRSSVDPHARAVVARIIGRAAEPVPDARKALAALINDPHPRPRLEAVVACANRPGDDSLKLALTALDAGEPDRFLAYALGQSVFALEDEWRKKLSDDLSYFSRPSHLAYVLETVGGSDSADLARRALEKTPESPDAPRLLAVLARQGNASDLKTVIEAVAASRDLTLLDALLTASEERSVRPEAPFEPALASLISQDDEAIRSSALRLAGRWKTTGLTEEVRRTALDSSAALGVRSAALEALAGILGEGAVPVLRPLVENTEAKAPAIRHTAMKALAHASIASAAETGATLIASSALPADDLAYLLQPLVDRAGGSTALAAALKKNETKPGAKIAQALLSHLNSTGSSDPNLTPLLNEAAGIESAAPPYDAERVAAIVADVRSGKADVKSGSEIYQRAQLACVACHRVGDEGGVIGPALTNVGAGMPLDQIVESILWPARQIKEGFQPVSLTTKSGKNITGYLEREDDNLIWYRNTGAPWIMPLDRSEIQERRNLPTLMPAGLTHSLSKEELRDLVAYLASLKG